jgi:UDP-2,3-diacylglucosamine hydrolase
MTTPCELVGVRRWDTARALLISDLHLSPQSPLAMRAFCSLLAKQAPTYESLLILGDLFEVYAGDDALQHDAFVAEVAAALLAASAHCRIGIMHGNRDFLMGLEFCRAAGTHLLADPCILADLQAMPWILSHGDLWCTADLAYQSKKHEVRSPRWQTQVLSMPWPQRWALANAYREQSMAQRAQGVSNQDSTGLYDVQADAFESACVMNSVSQGLHGHTHAPARHKTLGLAGMTRARYVLGDWQFDVSVEHTQPLGTAVLAVWQEGAMQLVRYDGAVIQPFFTA